jgi:hypothetical protein
MKTTRVRVVRSHILGANRFAEVGDILDLPEHTAIERISNGSCEPAPAPPEPAPEAPAEVAEPSEPAGESAPEAPAEPEAAPATPTTTRGPRAGKEKP